MGLRGRCSVVSGCLRLEIFAPYGARLNSWPSCRACLAAGMSVVSGQVDVGRTRGFRDTSSVVNISRY